MTEIVAGIADAATMREDPRGSSRCCAPGRRLPVALARESGAEVVISGDKDLLDHPCLEPAIDARGACKLLGLLD